MTESYRNRNSNFNPILDMIRLHALRPPNYLAPRTGLQHARYSQTVTYFLPCRACFSSIFQHSFSSAAAKSSLTLSQTCFSVWCPMGSGNKSASFSYITTCSTSSKPFTNKSLEKFKRTSMCFADPFGPRSPGVHLIAASLSEKITIGSSKLNPTSFVTQRNKTISCADDDSNT